MMERLTTVWNFVGAATEKTAAFWQEVRRTRFVRSFLEAWWWGVNALVRPVPTIQRAAEEKPLFPALWLTLLQGFSFAFGTRYAIEHEGWMFSWLIKRLPSWEWVLLYVLVFPPVLWFLKAAILNMVAELLGGPPRGMSLLAATAVACSPLLLVLPVALVAAALAQPNLDTGFVGHLWFIFALGVHPWWVLLTFVAVRETYRFTIAQAILTLLLAAIAAVIGGALIYLVLQAAV